MARAAIWARVSSPGQADISPESQIARVKGKLHEMGYEVTHVLQVVWTSSDLKPCPEFQQLKNLIRKGEVEAVGMLDRDRIEANGLQRLNFLADCREKEVTPIVYQGAPFLEGIEGQIVELALAMGKEKANERAQSGAKQGLEDRAKGLGKKNNGRKLPPTSKQVWGMTWDDAADKYVPNEWYEAARTFFELWFEFENVKKLAAELYNRRIPTPRGKRIWAPSSIITILANPVYAGRVATLKYEAVEPKSRRAARTFGKSSARKKPESEWHWLEDRVANPIITWEQHLAIKAKLARNRQMAKRNTTREYLCRGIIECMLCGRHLYGVTPSSGRAKYVCSNRWGAPSYAPKCQSAILDLEEVDQGLRRVLRTFLEKPELYLAQAEAQLDVVGNTRTDIENKMRSLEREFQKTLDDERRKVNLLSDEAFRQEQRLIVARRNWLSDETDRQRRNLEALATYEAKTETVESLRERFQYNLDNATYEDWRAIIDGLDVKVLSFGDGTWDVEVSLPTREADLVANTTARTSSPWGPPPTSPRCTTAPPGTTRPFSRR